MKREHASATNTERNYAIKTNMEVKEMASYLGIGKTRAYQIIKQPDFPAAFRIGKKILINRNRLDEWMNERMREGV